MSVLSILCVGFPEETLLLFTILVTAGYKDALNFTSVKNVLKLLLASILLTIPTVVIRSFVELYIYNVILGLIIYPLPIYIIFKQKLHKIFIGVLLAVLVLILGEAVTVTPILQLFSIPLEKAQNSDLIRILLSLPVRTVQLLVIIILSKVKNISFHALKLSTEELIQTILCGLLIISSMISVEKGLRNITRDVATITVLIVNVCIIIIFSAYLIYKIFSLKSHSLISRKIHDFELERIRNLLKEGYTDHVIELIDETLKERGK